MRDRIATFSEESVETGLVWFAACLSAGLAVSAFAPSRLLQATTILIALALAGRFLPDYLRRATPAAAVAITSSAALFTTLVATQLSGFAWASGRSWSTTGVSGSPSEWLFRSMSWCLAIGLLATGRFMAHEARRSGHIGRNGYRVVSGLAVVSFAGFLIVGAFPVGSSHISSVAHNIAGVSAMGPFWIGMVASVRVLPNLSRRLRLYSAAAAVLLMVVWLPTAFRFVGLAANSPVSTLSMELVVTPLCLIWALWIAREWAVPGEDDPLGEFHAREQSS